MRIVTRHKSLAVAEDFEELADHRALGAGAWAATTAHSGPRFAPGGAPESSGRHAEQPLQPRLVDLVAAGGGALETTARSTWPPTVAQASGA